MRNRAKRRFYLRLSDLANWMSARLMAVVDVLNHWDGELTWRGSERNYAVRKRAERAKRD